MENDIQETKLANGLEYSLLTTKGYSLIGLNYKMENPNNLENTGYSFFDNNEPQLHSIYSPLKPIAYKEEISFFKKKKYVKKQSPYFVNQMNN